MQKEQLLLIARRHRSGCLEDVFDNDLFSAGRMESTTIKVAGSYKAVEPGMSRNFIRLTFRRNRLLHSLGMETAERLVSHAWMVNRIQGCLCS